MVNLTIVDLKGVNLKEANLEGANLYGVDLKNKDLRKTNLKGANLEGAKLKGANLEGTNLEGANLCGVDLKNKDLRKTNLKGANLEGANLERANLEGAYLKGANLIRTVLKQANLRELDIDGINLFMADLSEANLCGTRFTPEGVLRGNASFLDLSTCIGLETAKFSEPDFLTNYLTKAFEYATMSKIPEQRWPEFVGFSLRNIKILRSLYTDQPLPEQLIQVVGVITSELIRYLKKHPKAMYQIKPRQFEELIAEILASYGWQVNLTPTTRDGGYDIYAISPVPGNETTSWIIECKKNSQNRKVSLDIVRSLYGLRMDLRVANALLATTSYFSRDAHAYKISRYDLKLKDYGDILEWINEYHPNPNGKLYIKDNRLILPDND